jgi:hypothetical protein
MRRVTIDPRRILRAVALSAIGAAALLAGPLAEKSAGGTYNATDCAGWDNGYSNATYSESYQFNHYSDCGLGGNGLVINFPFGGTAQWQGASWWINTPAGTYFSDVSFMQRGAWDPSHGWDIAAFAVDTGGVPHPINVYKDGVTAWRGIGTPTSGTYSAAFTWLVCTAGGGCPTGSLVAGILARDFVFRMHDDLAPSVDLSGPLVAGGVKRGTDGVDVSATDSGAGLTSLFLLVNGTKLTEQGYGCTPPGMRPCGPSRMVHFDLDTQRAPFHDGGNEVQGCAADYATTSNPNVDCTATRLINVDNSCVSSPVPGGTNLSAQFERSGESEVTVRSGRFASVKGRLSDQSGAPVVGATLCVREATLAPGGELADIGTVKTNASGRYRYTVAPGPSRDVQVAYRYNRHQLQRDLRYYAKVAPSLKLSRKRVTNGARIGLFGTIPGPRNHDRIVVLQARYPGTHVWRTFQKARTNTKGQFLAHYRFTATFVTAQYWMRAVVPAQNGYPFLSGHSRKRLIKVIGRR